MPDMLTIRESVTRAKAEGLPVTEYSLRCWVRTGSVPARKVGQKVLLWYPNLVRFLKCEDGADNTPVAVPAYGTIRPVER